MSVPANIPTPPAPRENKLSKETSPYLLQHKDNPVHWQPWGSGAFAVAKAQNKPVLLSVGYAACHWCHVMAHESFENPAIAAVMNELFVNIKVDREERPDVDAQFQSALALLGQQGGWPLTMFLTPDGEAFWGGTYFPPDERYGRPAFGDVLRRVAQLFHNDPGTIAKNRDALRAGLERLAAPPARADAPALSLEALDGIAQQFWRLIDPLNGGLAGAPKFPQTSIIELLWRAYRRTGAPLYRHAVTLTLDRMSQGGIYDHLGGGYARYSTDARWLAPHFEKMLYDNAQLLELLTSVWADTRRPLYAARVRETIAWLLREMQMPEGAFAATLDADTEGEEGKFYVWTEAEIDSVLGPESTSFKRAYDVSPAGNWEAHNILNRLRRPELGAEAEEAALAASRAKLLSVRERRPKPGLDDKILADWNGMAIAALALASTTFDDPSWLDAARRAYDFVRGAMSAGDRLGHSWRAGRLQPVAMLDDYAHMARAALALHQATGEGAYVADAERWVTVADRHYWDDVHGGYYFTADDGDQQLRRTRSANDHATPAGNSIMLAVLTRLWHLTGKDAYRARAEHLIRAAAGGMGENVLGLASFFNAFEFFTAARQVVIIGDLKAAATGALTRAAIAAGHPDLVLTVMAPGASLPPTHPAAGRGMIRGQPTAYVCVGTSCSLPTTDAASLGAQLAATNPQ
jgi:uncharacterized protein